MTQATNNTVPQAPIDLQDPSSVFMVLEELGIAYMQYYWVTHVEPTNEKKAELDAQYHEFMNDCVALFSNPQDSRLLNGNWAGSPMATHVATLLQNAPSNPKTVIRAVLDAYIEALQTLIQREVDTPASVTPEVYVQFMTSWARFIAGDTNRDTLA